MTTAMAATTFPRFLELPFELQMQIWEEATKGEVHDFLKSPHHPFILWFEAPWGPFTMSVYHPQMGWHPYVLGHYRPPRFRNIIHACGLSRLAALMWWKNITRPPGFAHMKCYLPCTCLLDTLDKLILDLRTRLDGERRVAATQGRLILAQQAIGLPPAPASS